MLKINKLTPTNKERSIKIFDILTKHYNESMAHNEKLTALTDLLADVQHFCYIHSTSFNAAIRISTGHYLAEIAEELEKSPVPNPNLSHTADKEVISL